MNSFKQAGEGQSHLILNGVEYDFVINPEKVIGVRRHDGSKISEKEVRVVSDYVHAEGWTDKEAVVVTKKRRRIRATPQKTAHPKEAAELPAMRMPPPLTPCPKEKSKARSTLTKILKNTFMRLRGLPRLS